MESSDAEIRPPHELSATAIVSPPLPKLARRALGQGSELGVKHLSSLVLPAAAVGRSLRRGCSWTSRLLQELDTGDRLDLADVAESALHFLDNEGKHHQLGRPEAS